MRRIKIRINQCYCTLNAREYYAISNKLASDSSKKGGNQYSLQSSRHHSLSSLPDILASDDNLHLEGIWNFHYNEDYNENEKVHFVPFSTFF